LTEVSLRGPKPETGLPFRYVGSTWLLMETSEQPVGRKY